MRWIWIDRFVEFRPGKSARAVKNLSLAEDHFADHFPGYPVMPAALILEGLAQTGGILVGDVNDFKEKVVLAKVPKAVFHRELLAGEQLIYEAEILYLRPERASVAPRVRGRRAGAAEPQICSAHPAQTPGRQRFGEHNCAFDGSLRRVQKSLGATAARPAAPTPN